MKSIKQTEIDQGIIGITTVGERGQIVIPKNIRDLLKIKKGFQFMTILHSDGLLLVNPSAVKKLSERLLDEVNKVNKNLKK